MFKKGEVIRCVETIQNKRVFAGVLYTVNEIFGEWMSLTHNIPMPYHISSFEKVNEMTTTINEKAKPKAKTNPKANTFYVRRVGGGSPKVVHTTYGDAMNEANRLAELNPSAEYQVIGVLYSVKKVPVYTTQAQEYSV
jgi:hypothetical protein